MKLIIAGGGVSALSLLKTLSLTPQIKASITEIVIYAPYGLGYASNFFNQPQSSLCNTSAGVMSLVYDQPNQYVDWLTQQGLVYKASDFTPRSLYGRFLREEAYHVMCAFQNLEIPLTVLNEAVSSFEYAQDKVLCFSPSGLNKADYLVIATGHQKRSTSTPNYLYYPEHQEHIMANDFDGQRVLVLGSRLSAIDAILLLEDKKLRQLDVASRSAHFPAVRKKLLRTDPKVLNTEHIISEARRSGISVYTQFTQAMHDEISLHFEGDISVIHHDGLEQLNVDINNMLNNNIGWEDTLDNIMLHLNTLWPHFSEAERSMFYKQYGEFMKRYLYAFPVQNAQRLQKSLTKFNARILTGDCRHLCLNPDGQFVLDTSTYDYVIDASGCRKMPITRHCEIYSINDREDGENMTQTKFNLKGENKVYVTGSVRTFLPVVNYVNEIAQFNKELVSDLFKNIKNVCFV